MCARSPFHFLLIILVLGFADSAAAEYRRYTPRRPLTYFSPAPSFFRRPSPLTWNSNPIIPRSTVYPYQNATPPAHSWAPVPETAVDDPNLESPRPLYDIPLRRPGAIVWPAQVPRAGIPIGSPRDLLPEAVDCTYYGGTGPDASLKKGYWYTLFLEPEHPPVIGSGKPPALKSKAERIRTRNRCMDDLEKQFAGLKCVTECAEWPLRYFCVDTKRVHDGVAEAAKKMRGCVEGSWANRWEWDDTYHKEVNSR